MTFMDYGFNNNGDHYLYLKNVSDNDAALLRHLGFELLDCNKGALINDQEMETWIKYNWISVEDDLPKDMEDVQVTYIAHKSGKPLCDMFAYMNKDKWYWSVSGDMARVKIIAWKHNCKPYNE